MQFFPSELLNSPLGLTKSVQNGKSNSAKNLFSTLPDSSNASFQDIFAGLSAYTPNNTPGVSLTMRSNKDDSSYFKSSDFQFLKSKLLELGVNQKSIDEYFGVLAQGGANPDIGNLRGVVAQMSDGRITDPLNKQDLIKFNAILSKLGFNNEELAVAEKHMENGEGLAILKSIQKKIKNNELDLTKEELELIAAACDLYGHSLKPLTQFFENSKFEADSTITVSASTFQKIFGSSIATLEQQKNDILKLSENLEEAIQAMLENKKTQPNEAVANIRGSALTERSETMARILATLIDNDDDEGKASSTSHLTKDDDSAKILNKKSIPVSLSDKAKEDKAVEEKHQNEIMDAIRGKGNTKNEHGTNAIGRNASLNENSRNSAEQQNNRSVLEQSRNAVDKHFAQSSTSENPSRGFTSNHENNGKTQQDFSASGDATLKVALSAKIQENSGVVFGLFGSQGENSSSNTAPPVNAKAEFYHERIFDQIERGIIKNASDGSRQITLRLDPPELGKLTLSLAMAQGEVKAVIRTESSATTTIISEQLAQLKQSLEEQGFKVSSLEVETRPQSHAGTDNWSGTEQHNKDQEMLEQSRFLRLSRIRSKEGNVLARSLQHIEQSASLSATGLHIIA